MPRKDGFPTNREMLVDFTTTSGQVFLDAYERDLGAHMHPMYQDKPLSHLSLRINRGSPETEPVIESGVISESLIIKPLNVDKDFFDQHLTLRDLPQDIKERYIDLSARLASIALSETLRLSQLFPPEAADASYTARMSNGRQRHVDTFKEKPSKMSIAAGQFFADEALEYTKSEEFDVPLVVRKLRHLSGEADSDPAENMRHAFRLAIREDLPLNGYEPRSFLEMYQRTMAARAERSKERRDRMEERGFPQRGLDFLDEMTLKYQNALHRVNNILEKKND
jgi:hypothetical protein